GGGIGRLGVDGEDARRAVIVPLQRRAVDGRHLAPLAIEEEGVGPARRRGEGEPEAGDVCLAVLVERRPRELDHRPARDTLFDEGDMVGVRVAGGEDKTRKPLFPDCRAEARVAQHEAVAGGHRRIHDPGVAHGQRLDESAVGEIDAGIDGAEGVGSLRRDGEAEPLKPLTRRVEAGDRQDEVVEAAPAHTSRLCSTAAAMKLANSGCGSNGRDFSSGWYWTPMNQGWSAYSIVSGSTPSGDMPENTSPQASSRSL